MTCSSSQKTLKESYKKTVFKPSGREGETYPAVWPYTYLFFKHIKTQKIPHNQQLHLVTIPVVAPTASSIDFFPAFLSCNCSGVSHGKRCCEQTRCFRGCFIKSSFINGDIYWVIESMMIFFNNLWKLHDKHKHNYITT